MLKCLNKHLLNMKNKNKNNIKIKINKALNKIFTKILKCSRSSSSLKRVFLVK